MAATRTMFEKIWSAHVVRELGSAGALLHVDRHLIHDLVAGPAFEMLKAQGLAVRNPELTFATPDHGVTSKPDRLVALDARAQRLVDAMRVHTVKSGIRMFDLDQPGQGIVHVIGPELGLTLPGTLIACGDSHSCTHGGLGAIAFGIGTSEVVHVLATQTIRQRKPRTLRISFDGMLTPYVTAKDMILFALKRLGSRIGQGHAIEFAGSAVRALGIEARLTLCNMSIELGAKIGMIAPDDVALDYIEGRPFAPSGAAFERACGAWLLLASDPEATFDQEYAFDVGDIAPHISWGTNPEDSIGIQDHVPDPGEEKDPERRRRLEEALIYMDLKPRQPIAGLPVDWVFIGSCANGRLSDLRAAAAVAKGRKVAPGVRAWVVPGSRQVAQDAVAEGLDVIFRSAGFEWREPGCSLCFGSASEHLQPGQRSVSTTNRNFVGRQGKGARTHLASPATAAATAITGRITDVRQLGAAA